METLSYILLFLLNHRQCAENLVNSMSAVFGDLFYLLQYGERRIRWPDKETENDYNYNVKDIFLLKESAPLLQLGMLFYLIIAENIVPVNLPKIYCPVYQFRMGIYLVLEMIKSFELIINFKGLKFCYQLLKNVNERLSSDELDLVVHRDFCSHLTSLLSYSNSKRNRKIGLMVLKSYILKFDDEGRYLILKNLLKSTDHKGIKGYLITLYKDIAFEAIFKGGNLKYVSGEYLKFFLNNHFGKLPGGAECDLMENSDIVISSLNLMIGILQDRDNKTNIRDYISDLQQDFLNPLRTGLDLSKAHYKNEIVNVQQGKLNENFKNLMEKTEILNDDGAVSAEVSDEKKIDMLNCALNSFDIIESLLSRVNQIIDEIKKK